MSPDELVLNLEAALLSAARPVMLDELVAMFEGREDAPDRGAVRDALATLAGQWHGRSLEVSEVASGFRAQIRKEFSRSVSTLWQERPARYSRALLETLALIAYRQPVSRGEIEEVRGVSVSSSIMKTLLEREWVRVVGHRETPGRPALYGTTRRFLDTFNLKSLEGLPPLAALKDLDETPPDLFFGLPAEGVTEPEGSGEGEGTGTGEGTGEIGEAGPGVLAEPGVEPEAPGDGAEEGEEAGEGEETDETDELGEAGPDVLVADAEPPDDRTGTEPGEETTEAATGPGDPWTDVEAPGDRAETEGAGEGEETDETDELGEAGPDVLVADAEPPDDRTGTEPDEETTEATTGPGDPAGPRAEPEAPDDERAE